MKRTLFGLVVLVGMTAPGQQTAMLLKYLSSWNSDIEPLNNGTASVCGGTFPRLRLMARRTSELETSRFLLRPLGLADADQIQILFPHWEIVRYLAKEVPRPYPPDGAYFFVRDVALPSVERGEAWHWRLRLKDEPAQLIGSISLMRGRGQESRILARPPLAGARPDVRSLRSHDRLLV